MQDVLTAAIEMHQTGQLRPAAQLYQKVLAHEEENADALHLLGVLRHQQGDHAKAVELIRRAIAMRPSVPAFHANLAEAYRSQGQFDRAAGSCRMALPRSSRPTRAGRGRQRAEDRNTEVRFERVGGCCSSHCSGIRFEEVLDREPDRGRPNGLATRVSTPWRVRSSLRRARDRGANVSTRGLALTRVTPSS